MQRESKCVLGKNLIVVVVIVALIIAVVVGCCKFREIHYWQEKVAFAISEIQQDAQQPSGSEAESASEHNMGIDRLMDQTAVLLEMISVGVALFALFGGFLSVFNILKSRELLDAIKCAHQATEDQQELHAHRLLQEGRSYAIRNRPAYAAERYQQAMDLLPNSFTALSAEYELATLYSDVTYDHQQSGQLEEIIKRFTDILSHIESTTSDKVGIQHLRGEVYFALGCINGTYGAYQKNSRSRYVKESIKWFEKSIDCDPKNVDYYRHIAASYQLAKDNEKKYQAIEQAKRWAAKQLFYTASLSDEAINALIPSADGTEQFKATPHKKAVQNTSKQ